MLVIAVFIFITQTSKVFFNPMELFSQMFFESDHCGCQVQWYFFVLSLLKIATVCDMAMKIHHGIYIMNNQDFLKERA